MREFFSGLNKKFIVAILLVGQIIAPITAVVGATSVGADTDINTQEEVVCALSEDGTTVECEGHNVEFTKTATPGENSGEVDITLKARGPVECIVEPIWVVVVFDNSGSMGASSSAAKFVTAKNATNSFVEGLFGSGDCIIPEVAMVTFNTDATLTMGWQSTLQDYNNNVKFDNPGGSTNLQEALALAKKTLDGKTTDTNNNPILSSQKYIVVISDGEPTKCPGSRNNGVDNCVEGVDLSLTTSNDGGSGNSTSEGLYDGVRSVANEIKSDGITIFTLGYDTDASILDEVATDENHYTRANSSSIADDLTEYLNGQHGILTQSIGKGDITDIINDNFEFVSGDGIAIHENGVVTCEIASVNSLGNGCTFTIKLKEDRVCSLAEGDLLNTNAGASLEFNDMEKNPQRIDMEESPQYTWDGDLGDIVCEDPKPCPFNPELDLDDPDCKEGGFGGNEEEEKTIVPKTGFKKIDNNVSRNTSANVSLLFGTGITLLAIVAVGAVRKYQK